MPEGSERVPDSRPIGPPRQPGASSLQGGTSARRDPARLRLDRSQQGDEGHRQQHRHHHDDVDDVSLPIRPRVPALHRRKLRHGRTLQRGCRGSSGAGSSSTARRRLSAWASSTRRAPLSTSFRVTAGDEHIMRTPSASSSNVIPHLRGPTDTWTLLEGDPDLSEGTDPEPTTCEAPNSSRMSRTDRRLRRTATHETKSG